MSHGVARWPGGLVAQGVLLLTLSLSHCLTGFAGEWPSLFRGVAVAASPIGVQVVGVEATSPAALADLRPEDVIVRIQEEEIRSLEQFADVSRRLKGRLASAHILVFRNGLPKTLALHLHSDPVLRAWGLAFVPNDEIRFADPVLAHAYWRRLGRGFAEAGKPAEALDAYLNALHVAPDDSQTAFTAALLHFQLAQDALRTRELARAVASLRQALLVMERLFDSPLTDAQYEALRAQLAQTLQALRTLAPSSIVGMKGPATS